ncbi:MAG: hypothetical protein PHV34_08795 [Verrucomicrobiae bacterium]|nr:hypothetical protein [Verrucomicrobiae bacterium]
MKKARPDKGTAGVVMDGGIRNPEAMAVIWDADMRLWQRVFDAMQQTRAECADCLIGEPAERQFVRQWLRDELERTLAFVRKAQDCAADHV